MATTEKKSNFREDFPGYQGHIPYKYSIIGKTVGSTNETIKELLSTEPPKRRICQSNSPYKAHSRIYGLCLSN